MAKQSKSALSEPILAWGLLIALLTILLMVASFTGSVPFLSLK